MSPKHLTPLAVLNDSFNNSIQQAVDAFLLDCEARRLTKAAMTHYRFQVQHFQAYLTDQGISELQKLTGHHIRAYLVHLQQRGLKANSQHAAARAIRAWCNFMVADGLIDVSPMRNVKMPRLDKEIQPAFTPDDVRKLIGACTNERDRAVVLCLLDSGSRAQEFVNLEVGDVDMKSGAVHIRQGKGRKDRIAFLGAKARKALLKYMIARPGAKRDEPLWLSETSGERLTIWGLRLLLQRLGRRANVKHCHAHTFRRSFALWSLRNGMNIYALQQIMGHSDLNVLRKYLALVEQDLQEAHRKYGAVDNIL